MDFNIFVFGGYAKKINARKMHYCHKCNRPIHKDDKYYFYSSAKYIPWYDLDEIRKCDRAYTIERYHIKCNTKQHYHIERANNRKGNCPDENFEYVWQGGWCGGSHPCPDGGDVQLECHNCNLHCI